MVEDTLYQLFAPSEAFFKTFMVGAAAGRKLKVWDYFRNYFEFMYQLTTNLFEYDGIPKQLALEIERRLFFFGRAGVVNHKGKLTAVNVNTHTPDVYGRPTQFNFSFLNADTAEGGYNRIIGENGVLAINSYDMYPTALIVEHYALIAAHCDASTVNYLVNTRVEDVFKAVTQSEAEKVREYQNKIYNGETSVILDKLEEIEVSRTSKASSGAGRDIIELKERYLKDFYNMFGISRTEEKKERMVVGEVNQNGGMLRLNLQDMLDMREQLCKDLEEVFGLPCSVEPLVDIDGDTYMEGPEEMAPEEPAQEGGKEDVRTEEKV